jgi:threonine dehydrogenase-like Zn-dependent dehydrogenase
MLSDSMVDAKSLITYRFPLDDWESAFATFTDPASQTVQVLIIP